MTFEEVLKSNLGRRSTELIQELQGLSIDVVAGAATDTNIAITGIATDDTILSVIQFDLAATSLLVNIFDRTAETSITSAGNIQLTTTTTTGDKLIVVWHNKVA